MGGCTVIGVREATGALDVVASATDSPVTAPTNNAATIQPARRCPTIAVIRRGFAAAGGGDGGGTQAGGGAAGGGGPGGAGVGPVPSDAVGGIGAVGSSCIVTYSLLPLIIVASGAVRSL